ncbi:leucine-rich repeat-containing protein egg-6-like [Copidosoma floridanum]|uniref:leucine-rich repeat-containing protein egg-6-like n=1 Tax=Copidosoma floridanum TaxID=29053 RepID=UPI0006C94CCE|nr:leucine-rich repeat-containing protein egg-6-like [Copidosoma floridanum]
MLQTLVLLLISSSLKHSTAHHFFDPDAINFPLRNVQHSINLDTFVTSERNITAGKCEHVSSQQPLVLNLPGLGMSSPPNPYPGFIDSSTVTCLNLASNDIFQVVPGSFERLPNLSYLDLSKNRIQLCDFFNFGNPHKSLVTLIIEENSPPIDNIDHTIGKSECFPKLRHLYLRRNSIRSLNFSLRKAFPALTHLFLSDNSLDSQTFIRDLPPTLTHLFLEHNLISSLDCKIVRDVQVLHLDGNIVRAICHSNCRETSLRLEGAHKLTELTISSNRITEIESCAFQDSRSLRVLNVAGNSLEEIKRETLERLADLRELNLDDNHLTGVPNLCKNNQLTSVSLRRNKLRTIRRESFKGLHRLKCLFLGGNQIRSIEAGSFEDLESLTDLDLSSNDLDFIPSDWLKWQWNLRTLDVRGNRFKSLEQMSLSSAPLLSTIYLQDNPVSHVSGAVVAKLSPNVVVHLRHECSAGGRDSRSECHARCNEQEVRERNETYSRWINNL